MNLFRLFRFCFHKWEPRTSDWRGFQLLSTTYVCARCGKVKVKTP
jgi:hypothetical protein